MTRTLYYLPILMVSLWTFQACGDANLVVPEDYRELYIGTYDCTKSNRSFEDDMFTTDIVVEVSLDTLSDNSVIVNNLTFHIDENGQFGPMALEENSLYELDLSNDRLRYSSKGFIPNGIILPCYIKGVKRG